MGTKTTRLLVACLACAACAAPVDPLIELGTGLTEFEPIEDGQDIPMIEGVQAGWHLWISVRAQGLPLRGSTMEISTAPEATGRPRQTTIQILDLERHGLFDVSVGHPAVLSQPECFQDQRVTARVVVIDAYERRFHDERVVIPRWPEPIGECNHSSD